MALRKHRWDHRIEPAAPRARPSADLDNATAAPSPARALQHELALRTSKAYPPYVEKWSARRRLAFLLTAAAGSWLALLAAGAGVVHAVA